ncbi:MAG TPA: MBL fold metallo-hydrolase [Steroidobacteraceae bacterium]|jgi:7,8-dihydropterin-6-yl-methyl-4-(beta-D-ribofuranosyl)aminobenzene 5'-phosphate synthase
MSGQSPENLLTSRREVLCAGGASALTAIVTLLLGDTKPVRAAPISRVPEIDALAVRVVVDCYQFAVARSATQEGLEIQHFGWGIREDSPPGRTLVSEFGLAMHVESRRGTQTRRALMDFGFTPEALTNNTELLGIDPSQLDALVLSHGHYDHFGGLVGFLRKHKSRLKPKLPFYVGGEDCFCSRQWTAPPVRGDFGALDREALTEANLSVTYAEGPSLVADHGFTTGQIGQRSFEKLLSPTAMKIGVASGVGCFAERLPENERSHTVVPDQFRHEIALAFNLRGKGLVLLTSCSHRGVINAVRQAQAASGIEKVHALVGGFHLAPYEDEYVQQTVAALKEINIDHVIPLHCTGESFYDKARAQMPGKVLRSYTGTRFVFS